MTIAHRLIHIGRFHQTEALRRFLTLRCSWQHRAQQRSGARPDVGIMAPDSVADLERIRLDSNLDQSLADAMFDRAAEHDTDQEQARGFLCVMLVIAAVLLLALATICLAIWIAAQSLGAL
jgi:hypothetical protein